MLRLDLRYDQVKEQSFRRQMKIESSDADIETLLGSRFFEIPRFQRPYSWEEENILDLWNDLVSAQTSEYFIGSMVVYRKDKLRYGVVDGQQRLTTLTILLCAIRDKFLEIGKRDLAEGVHQLIERKDISNHAQYVVDTETSFPYFQEHIQKFDSDPEVETQIRSEERNLRNAHDKFQSLIDGSVNAIKNDPAKSDETKDREVLRRLTLLRDAVLNLKVIFVILDDEDDAYIIFETLNTRGKDLALSDLVKNHFAKHLRTKGVVDSVKIKWGQLLETLSNSSEDLSIDTFIYHFWASRYESIPLKSLFPKIKKSITKQLARQYLDDFISDSRIYRSLYESTYAWDKNEAEAMRSLQALRLFKVVQPIPATLALVRSYRSNVIKYAKLRDALLAIESFHFHFTAITSSRSSGGISAMYSSFAQRLFSCSSPQAASTEISSLIRKLQDRIPAFDEFKHGFSTLVFTNSNSKQKNLVRYILRRFSLYHEYKTPVDYDELTIEHIYPQSQINELWPESLVGSIGNLVLLDEKTNGKLGSKDFNAKMKHLSDCGYTLPCALTRANSWTPDEVKNHTFEMAETAYHHIWKI